MKIESYPQSPLMDAGTPASGAGVNPSTPACSAGVQGQTPAAGAGAIIKEKDKKLLRGIPAVDNSLPTADQDSVRVANRIIIAGMIRRLPFFQGSLDAEAIEAQRHDRPR